MASGGSTNVDVFDVRKVRRLVELMNDHDLAEIDLRQGEQQIRLRRDCHTARSLESGAHFPASAQMGVGPQAISQPAGAMGAGGGAMGATIGMVDGANLQPPTSGEDPNALYITSPMIGTYYIKSSPDAASYVKVGDQVGPESVVCIVEAMKVFNEIPAGISGKIVSMLVDDGDAVEFGQKLFKLEKAT
jgi:acetyl-CoA carboxylase biotin carboxyl carrier protein